MEKEEAIKILNDYMGGKIDPESTELYHAIELVVDILESQPSLPSELDDAAIQAAQIDMCDRQIMEDSNEHRMLYSRIFRRGFKAGTEWMAKQGYTQEEIVEDKSLGLGYGVLPGVTPIINLPDSFKPGDKVIVQVRKKC